MYQNATKQNGCLIECIMHRMLIQYVYLEPGDLLLMQAYPLQDTKLQSMIDGNKEWMKYVHSVGDYQILLLYLTVVMLCICTQF